MLSPAQGRRADDEPPFMLFVRRVNVRFWHLTDMAIALMNVCFRGKADIDAHPRSHMIERAPADRQYGGGNEGGFAWLLCARPLLQSSTRSCSATHLVPPACGKYFPTTPLSRVT